MAHVAHIALALFLSLLVLTFEVRVVVKLLPWEIKNEARQQPIKTHRKMTIRRPTLTLRQNCLVLMSFFFSGAPTHLCKRLGPFVRLPIHFTVCHTQIKYRRNFLKPIENYSHLSFIFFIIMIYIA